MSYKATYDGEDIELDDDITVDDLDREATPDNLPDVDDPAIRQAIVEAEADDSNEVGEELDCDE